MRVVFFVAGGTGGIHRPLYVLGLPRLGVRLGVGVAAIAALFYAVVPGSCEFLHDFLMASGAIVLLLLAEEGKREEGQEKKERTAWFTAHARGPH